VMLFGWVRLVFRGELKGFKLNSLDKVLIVWSFVGLIAYTILWGSSDAFKYKLGGAYNNLGFYFMFRFLIRDMEELIQGIKLYALLVVPLAGFMILEKMTGHDSFSVFGGVPPTTYIREGTLRCQGPFAHPILAGTFGATLMPLFVGLWQQKKNRLIALGGIVAAAIITITSASSGPLLACILGLMAIAMWPLRLKMRKIRWGIVFSLAGLQLVMKAPVWFLLARVDVFNGSTGYHRALLIDRAIANLSDWWLVGTQSTWKWASEDDHLFDVTNNYILNGADGGLLTMILFIAIVAIAFKGGRTGRARLRRKKPRDRSSHVVGFGRGAICPRRDVYLGELLRPEFRELVPAARDYRDAHGTVFASSQERVSGERACTRARAGRFPFVSAASHLVESSFCKRSDGTISSGALYRQRNSNS
jgi:hypothetical protein